MSKEWTEDDELRYERERKSSKEKEILKMRDDAQKKFNEHEYNYQYTGSGSTYRTMIKYENIIEVCNLALKALNNECRHCESHRRTVDSRIKKYEEAKKAGLNEVLDFDEIIKDLYSCKYC